MPKLIGRRKGIIGSELGLLAPGAIVVIYEVVGTARIAAVVVVINRPHHRMVAIKRDAEAEPNRSPRQSTAVSFACWLQEPLPLFTKM